MTIAAAVRTCPATSVDLPGARYKGFRPATSVLYAASRYQPGALQLPCDIVRDKDVALKMRDGTSSLRRRLPTFRGGTGTGGRQLGALRQGRYRLLDD